MDHTPADPALYGVMAEFDDPTALVEAAQRTYDAGYRQFDAFSPFRSTRSSRRWHIKDRRVSLLVLGRRHHGRV